MAEGVQYAMETMVEEFQEMKRLGLFNDEEIKAIKIKREDFEYKLRSVTKSLDHYLNYINYEIDVLTKIRTKRDQIEVGARKGGLEYKLIERVKNLYEQAVLRYPENFELCVNRFVFCKRINYVPAATTAIDFLLKNHQKQEQTFYLAAFWYAKKLQSVEQALQILLKGIVIHEKSKLLYKQLLSLELSNAHCCIKNSENSETEEGEKKLYLYCEKLKHYLNLIFKHIKDPEYYFELLELFDRFSFTTNLKKYTIEHLVKEHCNEPMVWHMLAQRDLTGFNTGVEAGMEDRIRMCNERYSVGLKNLSHDKKSQLWELYLNHLTERHKKGKCSLDTMNKYLELAHTEKCLTEKYYYYWLELNKDRRPLDIFEKALEAYPASDKLWLLYVQYKIRKKSPVDEINLILDRAIAAVKEKSLPLWSEHLKYNTLHSSPQTIQSLYERAINEPEQICNVFKPMYLKWLMNNSDGIDSVRRKYEELSKKQPFCKELHDVMATTECVKQDWKRMEDVLKLKCEQFPSDFDAWTNYMEFAIRTKLEKDKCKRIYNNALCVLPEPLKSHFREKYLKCAL